MNTVVPVGARGNSSLIAVLGNKVGAREQPLPRCLSQPNLGKKRFVLTIRIFLCRRNVFQSI